LFILCAIAFGGLIHDVDVDGDCLKVASLLTPDLTLLFDHLDRPDRHPA